jgi:DNA-binding transcriptional ArsR family regulator
MDASRMEDRPDITAIAAVIGEPARGKMLNALMDGRALTATELALEAGVTPSTASSHLAQLRRAGLISVAAQGRHRYFRIATSSMAALLERLMGIAAASAPMRSGPRDATLRRARVCYDHLAAAKRSC